MKLIFTRGDFLKVAIGAYGICFKLDYAKLRDGWSVASVLIVMALSILGLHIFLLHVIDTRALNTGASIATVTVAFLLAPSMYFGSGYKIISYDEEWAASVAKAVNLRNAECFNWWTSGIFLWCYKGFIYDTVGFVVAACSVMCGSAGLCHGGMFVWSADMGRFSPAVLGYNTAYMYQTPILRYFTQIAGFIVCVWLLLSPLRSWNVVKAKSRIDRVYLFMAESIFQFIAPACYVHLNAIMRCRNSEVVENSRVYNFNNTVTCKGKCLVLTPAPLLAMALALTLDPNLTLATAPSLVLAVGGMSQRIMMLATAMCIVLLVSITFHYHTFVKNQQTKPLTRTLPRAQLAVAFFKFICCTTIETVVSPVVRFVIISASFSFLLAMQLKHSPTLGYASHGINRAYVCLYSICLLLCLWGLLCVYLTSDLARIVMLGLFCASVALALPMTWLISPRRELQRHWDLVQEKALEERDAPSWLTSENFDDEESKDHTTGSSTSSHPNSEVGLFDRVTTHKLLVQFVGLDYIPQSLHAAVAESFKVQSPHFLRHQHRAHIVRQRRHRRGRYRHHDRQRRSLLHHHYYHHRHRHPPQPLVHRRPNTASERYQHGS